MAADTESPRHSQRITSAAKTWDRFTDRCWCRGRLRRPLVLSSLRICGKPPETITKGCALLPECSQFRQSFRFWFRRRAAESPGASSRAKISWKRAVRDENFTDEYDPDGFEKESRNTCVPT